MYLHHPERNDRVCKTGIDFGYPKPIPYAKAKIHFDLPLSFWDRFQRLLWIVGLALVGFLLLWPSDRILQFFFKLILIDLAAMALLFGVMQITAKVSNRELAFFAVPLELIKLLGFALLWLVILALFYGIGLAFESLFGGNHVVY